MSTLAVGFLFINVAELIWGRNPEPVPPFFGEGIVTFGAFAVFPQQLLVIASALVIFVFLHLCSTTGRFSARRSARPPTAAR